MSHITISLDRSISARELEWSGMYVSMSQKAEFLGHLFFYGSLSVFKAFYRSFRGKKSAS